jgi:outer membrane protein assembly factor BamB
MGLPRIWGFVLAACGLFPSVAGGENWPRFRGADGSGVSNERGIPAAWNASDVAWTTELPGEGHAAPIIWDRRLFVTSATADTGLIRELYALDAVTGEILWSRGMGFGPDHKHQKNSFASSTPATDGKRVYVAFSDMERFTLSAYDFEGSLVWRRILGPLASMHGLGASPIVFEDLVIMCNLQDGPSSIVAFDAETGRTVWSSLQPSRETSYATPIVIPSAGGKQELICVSGATGIVSLDPRTGNENWLTGVLPKRTVSSPVFSGGQIFATCGQGGKGTLMIGAATGQSLGTSDRVTFRRERDVPYVPTLLAYGEHLYLWLDQGIVICLDPKRNEIVWQERVGGTYSGSPICIDGKIYCIDEEGNVVVVGTGPEFQFFGRTPLGDRSHSTPSVANGRLYLRSMHWLTCVKAANAGQAGGN